MAKAPVQKKLQTAPDSSDNKMLLLFSAALYGACVGIALVRHIAVSGLIRFSYSGNPLGIRSLTHINQYPKQQDYFWYIFGVCLPIALALATALFVEREAHRVEPSYVKKGEIKQPSMAQPAIWFWSLGIFFIQLPILFTGAWTRGIFEILHIGALIAVPFIISKRISDVAPIFVPASAKKTGKKEMEVPREAFRHQELLFRYVLPFLVLFIIAWNPSIYRAGMDVNDEGSHLAWLEAMSRGGWPGADTAAKYGALLEWFLYGSMRVIGMTVHNFRWLTNLCLLISAFIPLFATLRVSKSRWAPWMAVLIIPCFNYFTLNGPGQFFLFRGAFPLISILLLNTRSERQWLTDLLAGFFAGLALGVSMEFGLVGMFSLGVGLALQYVSQPFDFRSFLRRSAMIALGVSAVVIPFFAIYASHGRLGLFFRTSRE